MLHSYSTIFAIGHKAVQPLLSVPCLVEEKVDGSQFSFRFEQDGSTTMRSKGAEVHAGDGGMFEEASHIEAEWCERWVGYTFRCEYLQKPKHNVLTYQRTPKANLIVFDVETSDGDFLSYSEKAAAAADLRLDVVPRLYEGMVTLAVMQELLDRESILGGTKIEGVVVKPVGYDLYGTDKKVLMGKYVSEGFKEKHSRDWKATNKPDVVSLLAEELRSEARWQKAIQHLKEQGRLNNEPKDIGPLMKEIVDDVVKEEKEYIKDKLYARFGKDILRQVTWGFPEWYKEKLMKEAFTCSEKN